MPVVQRADSMHLECVFFGDLAADPSSLGSAILSLFQERAFATAFSIRERTASDTKGTHEEDMDIHGRRLGWIYVGHHEFLACL